jgi:hypothetical protein
MNQKRKQSANSIATGLVLPLVFVLFLALPDIITQRRPGWAGAPPVTGLAAVFDGIFVLGLALAVHAWNFRFYRRFPLVRWTLVIAGGLTMAICFAIRFFER